MQWPEITELKDVTITPLFPGNSKSGGKMAASEPADVLVHQRHGRNDSKGRSFEIVGLSVEDAEGAQVIEEPVIYGGLLFNHFGHALAESIHRLWPRFAIKMLRKTKVAFSPVKLADVRPYMAEALDLHGISQGQILRIKRPVRFRRLFVGPQARQMSGPTLIDNYQTMLEPLLEARFRTSRRDRRLYVSRLDYLAHGSFYGESELSRQLAAQGFEIVYPERHSLTELVAMFRASALTIFAEGSAVHVLELCGSKVPDVLVISRRYPTGWGAELLTNICKRWMISNHVLFDAGISEHRKKHSGVLNLPAVMRDIQTFCGGSGTREWTENWAKQAIYEDLERLISLNNRDTEDYAQRVANLRETMRKGLNDVY